MEVSLHWSTERLPPPLHDREAVSVYSRGDPWVTQKASQMAMAQQEDGTVMLISRPIQTDPSLRSELALNEVNGVTREPSLSC